MALLSFQELGGRQAVRKGEWKLVHLDIRSDNDKYELYNLTAKPGETTDLSADNPEKVAELQAIMSEAHIANPDFPIVKKEKQQEPGRFQTLRAGD